MTIGTLPWFTLVSVSLIPSSSRLTGLTAFLKKTHKRSIYSQDSGVPKAPCKRGYIQGNPRGFLGSQKLKTIWNLVGNLAYGRLGSSPLGCLRIPSWGDHCHWVGGTPKKIPQNSFRIQYTKPPICFATFGVFRRSCSP